MKNSILLLLCYILFFPKESIGQNNNPNPEQLIEFKELTLRRVKDLQNYIQQIGDKALPERSRIRAIKLAISLFDTLSYDNAGNVVVVKPFMQISRRNGTKENVPIDTYFKRLMTLSYFPKIVVTAYDVAYCSDFEKGTDGNYHATAIYYQNFVGFDSKGKALYQSQDKKAIEVTEKLNARSEFTISFGNISVVETLPNSDQ